LELGFLSFLSWLCGSEHILPLLLTVLCGCATNGGPYYHGVRKTFVLRKQQGLSMG
jgi:hypothetical protein